MSTDPTVIVAGARTPMGRMSGSLKGFSGSDLGGIRHQGGAGEVRRQARGRRLRHHGPGALCRRGQIPARWRAVKAGIPMSVPALSLNRSALLRHRCDRPRRPVDPGREFEIIVAGGQGVDDQCPAPAGEEPRWLQIRQCHPARPHGLRRPVRCLHHARRHGGLTESANTGERAVTREEQDEFGPQPPGWRRGPGRTASSTTKSSPSPFRSASGRPD